MRKREALKLVVERIRQYGLRVNFGQLPAGFTGDLDGESITLDRRKLTDAEALFTAAHLFGHTVQWSTSAKARKLGLLEVKPPIKGKLLRALQEYELNAAGYGLQVLREADIQLEQWFADYTHSDLRYLTNFYTTGRKRHFRQFWQTGAPLIKARRVPKFTPKFRGGRNGVVI